MEEIGGGLSQIFRQRLFKLKLHFVWNLFAYLITFFLILPAIAAELCVEGKEQLREDYQIMQADGGLGTRMEYSRALKFNSALGFEVDNNLMRLLEFFETMCKKESPNKPDFELYGEIQKRIDKGRDFYNANMDKTTADQFLSELEAFNSDLDEFLQNLLAYYE